MHVNARESVARALAAKDHIDQVYWIGCGGSLIDLMPADYLMRTESQTIESHAMPAREFSIATPKRLGNHSMVVGLSHSGRTPETLEALRLAAERGAHVFAMTSGAGSPVDDEAWDAYVYEWNDQTPQCDLDATQSLMVCAELLRAQENWGAYDALYQGIDLLDGIIASAREKVRAELCEPFAELCRTHDFLYILGSGATFAQTYGFAICSLQEMQWQNCGYIHSAEYFHGPFECTEPGVCYFLQMSSAASRVEDERVLAFLETHTDTFLVLDTAQYGMCDIDERVRAYLEPIMVYYMNVELRAARGRVFNHDPSVRRYMGIEKY